MDPNTVCTQPHCALRQEGVDREFVSELAVASLTENAEERVAALRVAALRVAGGSEAIVPREACRSCVQRVMRGGRPLPLVEERLRDERAGRISRRRRRRRARAY